MDTKVKKQRQETLRTMLHGMREQVINDIEGQMGRRLDEAVIEGMGPVLDSEDRAALDLSDDVDLALLDLRYRHYKDIADAFRRLEDGSYGRCERCAADIPIERLKAEPSARYCVTCLNQIEAVERVEREEVRFKTAAPPSSRGAKGR